MSRVFVVDTAVVANRVLWFCKLIALFGWKEAEKHFGMRQTGVAFSSVSATGEPCDLEYELFHLSGPQIVICENGGVARFKQDHPCQVPGVGLSPYEGLS